MRAVRALLVLVPLLTLAPAVDVGAKPKPHRLIISEQRNGQLDLWAVNDDGTSPKQLTTNPLDDQQAAVSPDGQRIAFARGVAFDSVPPTSDLWIMDADGTNQRLLVGGLVALQGGVDTGVVALDLEQQVEEDPRYVGPVDTAEYRPSFSPDGTKVLFTRHLGYANQSIWVAAVDGRTAPKMVVDNATYAHWGPDGRIAYVSDPANGGQIVVANAEGKHARTITDVGGVAPQWSPDGRRIVYTSFADGPGKIFVINADGTGNRQVEGDVPKKAGFGTWSLDGSRIAFSSTRDMSCVGAEHVDCPRRVYTINADGTGVRQLQTGSDLDQYPTYIPAKRSGR